MRISILIRWGFPPLLNKVKALVDVADILKETCQVS